MWTSIAKFIIKNRTLLIIFLVISTAFMGYQMRNLEMSYDYTAVVPVNDPEMVYFRDFKKTFGEDANIIAIGLQDSALYELKNFQHLQEFTKGLSEIPGIANVTALPGLQYLAKDSAQKKLYPEKIFKKQPSSQAELDSLLRFVNQLQFYKDQIINSENGATGILVSIDKTILNSPKRLPLTKAMMELGDKFSAQTGVKLHYAGVPFVRSVMSTKVKKELQLFLILSVVVTIVTIFAFFKAWDAVIGCTLAVMVVLLWTVGTMGLFGYKINLLTALLPAIIIVMTVPTCIYLLNKYHQEYVEHGDKTQALIRTIAKLGLAAFMINATTAAGFIGSVFTDVAILEEFGIVAGINVFVAFFICLVVIPIFFSYMPAPNEKKLRYLYSKPVNSALTWVDKRINTHPNWIYGITIVATLLSFWGIYQIKAVSYMVDDLPEDSDVVQDLRFFERNFQGIMPLEIVINTGEKRGVFKLKNLEKIEEFEQILSGHHNITKPVSVVEFLKAARQAYYNNNPEFYGLPTKMDRNFVLLYLKNMLGKSSTKDTSNIGSRLINSFVDSTGQYVRISMKIADLGSYSMDTTLSNMIRPAIEKTFASTKLKANVTGTTVLFAKGNAYLNDSLASSLITAFVVIVLMIGVLFLNLRVVIISLIPNFVALLITGGLMGFMGIALKPSTSLIFSISFGIIVDSSIHYLAHYRQEIFYKKIAIKQAVSDTLMETGPSIIYTSIILFVGFVIFVWSSFGGTKSLGILMSASMLISMVTNLTLLPTLLNSFDTGKVSKDETYMLEDFDNFYLEHEDEEIDLNRIAIRKINPID
ncbi:efflux RND transporter permease subunit [Cytophagaceae bacterium DM2B3-1]|uniref:Efflux RND transporter permease subunit n=1 Tax=Xanthocytophaga flava TaxID=3048013 RepID=A0ABT7CRS8_9BACT|nr:efflux RND transporter permease subunit [Xanthocytophaga flavus]MDJ1496433.1 efflux RND transporter permease subunit [Xanthocytophaga flavus]